MLNKKQFLFQEVGGASLSMTLENERDPFRHGCPVTVYKMLQKQNP
jgi:hypothetical protein